MDEAILHGLSQKLGGRFRLVALVQKRLVQLMTEHDDVIAKSSGGRPIRLVVDEVAAGGLQLTQPDGTALAAPPEPEPGQPGK